METIKFLAYYLPQFHPIPENDKWWGKGFTEWTNVAKAKPLFKGHEQPILPGELGFYDLRVPDVKIKQAKLAKDYGIDGFIYYQYWFGNGKMLLEKPAEEMLKDKDIELPFCFCWANETWKGVWHGLENEDILIEQTYNGDKDYILYFNYLLPFFKDNRYIKVNNKPMFHIYRMEDIPDIDNFVQLFNKLAISEGFDGIYFVSTVVSDINLFNENKLIYGQVGIDIFNKMRYSKKLIFSESNLLTKIRYRLKKLIRYKYNVQRKKPLIYDYEKSVSKMISKIENNKYIPCVFPNWDNSARSGNNSMVFINSNPALWQRHLQKAVDILKSNPENPRFIIIKSWNEWGEGNYLEPDSIYGYKWLESVKKCKEMI